MLSPTPEAPQTDLPVQELYQIINCITGHLLRYTPLGKRHIVSDDIIHFTIDHQIDRIPAVYRPRIDLLARIMHPSYQTGRDAGR